MVTKAQQNRTRIIENCIQKRSRIRLVSVSYTVFSFPGRRFFELRRSISSRNLLELQLFSGRPYLSDALRSPRSQQAPARVTPAYPPCYKCEPLSSPVMHRSTGTHASSPLRESKPRSAATLSYSRPSSHHRVIHAPHLSPGLPLHEARIINIDCVNKRKITNHKSKCLLLYGPDTNAAQIVSFQKSFDIYFKCININRHVYE